MNVENVIRDKHTGDNEQLDFIFSDEARMIVTAPAGCGKTTAMISKIARELCSGSISSNKKVLAMTYSVNAAIRITLSRDPEKFGANYFTLLGWLREFDGLYADVSALLCINKARILPHLKTQTQIHDKILFGTDFPVPFSVILSSYDLPFRERLALNRIQKSARSIRARDEFVFWGKLADF